MAIYFGQFLDHDLSLSPEAELEPTECCPGCPEVQREGRNEECLEILVPPNDPFFSRQRPPQTCIQLTRSIPFAGTPIGTPSQDREQQNAITAFLDASNLYGSDDERNERIRTSRNGMLAVRQAGGRLMPEERFGSCLVPVGGDSRALENVDLATYHALFIREHNRIATELLPRFAPLSRRGRCSGACDELLFQNVRRIVSAEWQNIIYSEWLPLIIGNTRVNRLRLNLATTTPSTYNPRVDPSIISAFSAAAFRFGHSMLFRTLRQRNTANGRLVESFPLSTAFFEPSQYRERSGVGMEQLLAGMLAEPANQFDRISTREITNLLFQQNDRFGQDLIARNIARARDHGIPGFASYYAVLGPRIDANRRLQSWNNRPQTFSQESWNILRSVYVNPQDIDLFAGGLLEVTPAQNSGEGVLGNTFGELLGLQFQRLRSGDRFFFTHQGTCLDNVLMSSHMKCYYLISDNIAFFNVLILCFRCCPRQPHNRGN